MFLFPLPMVVEVVTLTIVRAAHQADAMVLADVRILAVKAVWMRME